MKKLTAQDIANMPWEEYRRMRMALLEEAEAKRQQGMVPPFVPPEREEESLVELYRQWERERKRWWRR